MKKYLLTVLLAIFCLQGSVAQSDSSISKKIDKMAKKIEKEALDLSQKDFDINIDANEISKNIKEGLSGFNNISDFMDNDLNNEVSNEERVEKNYDLKNFSSIKCSGIAKIIYTQGNKYEVKVKATKSFIDNLTIKVENGALIIDLKKGDKTNLSGKNFIENFEINVSSPTLKSVSIGGVVKFKSESIKGDSFELNVSGVAKVDCPSLDFANFVSKVSGAGYVNVVFKGESAYISNSGASRYTLNVDCKELTVKNSGAGSMKISGTADKTDINSSGVSDINISELNKF